MDNYKSGSLQLENTRQLQNNSVNGAMSITINRLIARLMTRLIVLDIAPLKMLFCNFLAVLLLLLADL